MTDQSYFRRRYRASLQLAERASCDAARRVHLELAERYALLAGTEQPAHARAEAHSN